MWTINYQNPNSYNVFIIFSTDDELKRFYRERAVPAFNNYAQTKAFLNQSYSSVSRQNCMRQYLQRQL